MTCKQHLFYWTFGFGLMAGILWLLGDVLFPFIAGMALAYFLDPIADVLQQWKMPRWVAAAFLTLAAIFFVFGALLVFFPLLLSFLVFCSVFALLCVYFFPFAHGESGL